MHFLPLEAGSSSPGNGLEEPSRFAWVTPQLCCEEGHLSIWGAKALIELPPVKGQIPRVIARGLSVAGNSIKQAPCFTSEMTEGQLGNLDEITYTDH